MPHIPVHPSAEKRRRQNEKRRERNRTIITRTRTAVKLAVEAIDGGDRTKAETQVRAATRALDKARTSGVIHRNTASRQVARLSARLNKIAKAVASRDSQ